MINQILYIKKYKIILNFKLNIRFKKRNNEDKKTKF